MGGRALRVKEEALISVRLASLCVRVHVGVCNVRRVWGMQVRSASNQHGLRRMGSCREASQATCCEIDCHRTSCLDLLGTALDQFVDFFGFDRGASPGVGPGWLCGLFAERIGSGALLFGLAVLVFKTREKPRHFFLSSDNDLPPALVLSLLQ